MPELSAQGYSVKDENFNGYYNCPSYYWRPSQIQCFKPCTLCQLWLLFGTEDLRMSSEIPPEIPLNTNTCCSIVCGEETQKDDSFDFKPFCAFFYVDRPAVNQLSAVQFCMYVRLYQWLWKSWDCDFSYTLIVKQKISLCILVGQAWRWLNVVKLKHVVCPCVFKIHG
jgi:hypothetical protein